MKKSLTHLAALAALNPQRSSPQLFGKISLPPSSPAPMYARLHEQSRAPLPYKLVTYPLGYDLPVPLEIARQISLGTIRRAAGHLRRENLKRQAAGVEIWWDETAQRPQERILGWDEVYLNPARDV